MSKFLNLAGVFKLVFLPALILLAFVLPVQAYITDDLAGYWPFDQNVGDYSSYKTPTTLDWSAGVPTMVGSCVVSGCYEFCTAGGACAGGSVYTDNTVPNLAGGSFSMAGWFLNDAANSNGWPVLYRWVGDYYVGINTTDNNITVSYKPNDSYSVTLDPSYAMAVDTWYHVAVVFDDAADQIYLYINGELEDQAAVSDSSVVGAVEALYFGEDPTYSTMSGQIDEVAIWQRALTQSDIDTLYNEGIGDDLPVVLDHFEWNFEDAYKRSLVATPDPVYYSPDFGKGSFAQYGNPVFTAWNTGYSGGFAPNSNTWTDGMDTKYWRIKINTFGLENLRVSSRQRSSSTGPRDFKLQYSISGRLPLVWVDVPGATITVADNFTTGVLTDIPLPVETENNYVLYLRWIMTSNISVSGGAIGGTGTSRIDDIVIEGDIINYSLTYTAGANGSLSGSVAQIVPYKGAGTAVTAVANAGYHFVDWSDGLTDNPRIDERILDNLSVKANFAIDNYTLTYNTDGNGTISGSSSQSINHGADGTAVTAVANLSYRFNSWSDGVTTASRTDLNVTADLTVTANFEKALMAPLIIPGGVGSGLHDESIPMYGSRDLGRIEEAGVNVLAYLEATAYFEAWQSSVQNWGGHSLQILSLDMLRNRVTLSVMSDPQIVELDLDEVTQLDLDSDGIKDIEIKFENLYVNRVELTLKSLLSSNAVIENTENEAGENDYTLVFGSEGENVIAVQPKVCPGNFNRNLKIGQSGADVKALQVFLNKEGFVLGDDGPGAVGQETEFFGSLTKKALSRYQQAKGIQAILGEFDLATRIYLACAEVTPAGAAGLNAALNSANYEFTRNLSLGMNGEDVRSLQKLLNNNGFVLTMEGLGSPGNETDFFGSLTKQSLIKYQIQQGIIPASGFFGDWTRWWVNKQ